VGILLVLFHVIKFENHCPSAAHTGNIGFFPGGCSASLFAGLNNGEYSQETARKNDSVWKRDTTRKREQGVLQTSLEPKRDNDRRRDLRALETSAEQKRDNVCWRARCALWSDVYLTNVHREKDAARRRALRALWPKVYWKKDKAWKWKLRNSRPNVYQGKEMAQKQQWHEKKSTKKPQIDKDMNDERMSR
jgi:hypothetical protein